MSHRNVSCVFFCLERKLFTVVCIIRLGKIEQYRKAWDKYSIWSLLISVTSIAVTGDVVRKYIPINLILLLGIINIVTMEIRIYYHDTKELY